MPADYSTSDRPTLRGAADGADGKRPVAVVTGGAGTIGSAIVESLAQRGQRVVVLDRSGDFACDLASESSTKAVAAKVLDRYGRCDVLVHCAASFDPLPVESFDLARWRAVQAVNVEAPLLLAQAFTPGMVQRAFGRIIFIVSDTAWLPPSAEFLPYVTSKGALLGIMRSLAVTLGAHNIAVTAVAPGLTSTSSSRDVVDAEQFAGVVATQAMKRPLVPSDTAETVAFLASDAAQALTGQVLVVDGGRLMR